MRFSCRGGIPLNHQISSVFTRQLSAKFQQLLNGGWRRLGGLETKSGALADQPCRIAQAAEPRGRTRGLPWRRLRDGIGTIERHDGCHVFALAAFTALGLQVESREAKRIHARVYCFEQQRKEHDDHRSLNPALHRAARVHRSVSNAVVVRAWGVWC